MNQEAGRHGKIVLVGFMGTGKSTVSRLLAEQLGYARFDTDEEIERSQGKRVAELFADIGEAGFRDLESGMIQELLSRKEPAIIATGGGAVLREANREAMLSGSLVVALKASAEQIIARVQSDSSRPLLQGDVAANVNRIMEQRRHAYDFAHLVLDTTSLNVHAVCATILQTRETK